MAREMALQLSPLARRSFAVRAASGVTLTRTGVPERFGLRPRCLPAARAAARPASTRSALTSVSYCATDASTLLMRRPAGVERSRPSRRETRFTPRRWSSSKSCVRPEAVRPSLSRRQITIDRTSPFRAASIMALKPGRSMVLPVAESRNHSTWPSRPAAQRLRSTSCASVSCFLVLTRL